jgi:hypothetical protein
MALPRRKSLDDTAMISNERIETRAILERMEATLRERQKQRRLQTQLWDENEDFHDTIASKLNGLWNENQYHNFCACGRDHFYRTCKCCGRTEEYPYKCNIKWCPRCSWKITEKRKNLIRLWAEKISQPKHLVLTQKNFPILTRRKIREHTRNLAKMRRQKSMKHVRGGCVSVEITNEGNGWHLHSHWLVDVDWLPMADVSIAWGKIVKQEFAIVKIKDVRKQDYLKEICKYVVEGSELAKWHPEEIQQFVRSVKGLRFFFSFGALYKLAPLIRAELAQTKREQKACECGGTDFKWESETSAILNEIRQQEKRK